jgi:hypothetical protein
MARPHRYDLFEEGRPIGRLEWRSHPRGLTGWHLLRPPDPPMRLAVDASIDDLAADQRADEHAWELDAELAAILSTALALDAADRFLHAHRQPVRRRFRRLTGAGRYEIYVADVDPSVLAHATPELALMSVADVALLEGQLLPEAFDAVIRRIALLGGRVVTVLRDEP